MWQKLRNFGAALALAVAFCLPVQAQDDNPFLKRPEKGPPVAEFAVATIATMIVMVVVCMPSRKR